LLDIVLNICTVRLRWDLICISSIGRVCVILCNSSLLINTRGGCCCNHDNIATCSQGEDSVFPGSRSDRCCGLGRSARSHATWM
jgi:hypothetical protein